MTGPSNRDDVPRQDPRQFEEYDGRTGFPSRSQSPPPDGDTEAVPPDEAEEPLTVAREDPPEIEPRTGAA